MTRWWHLPLQVSLLCAAGTVLAESPSPSGEATVLRPVISVILSADHASEREFSGQVSARTITDLGFTQGGKLAERPALRGAVLARGDLLASLDGTELDARLRAAEASLAADEAQRALAAENEARVAELTSRGVTPQAQLDAAKLATASAEAAVAQAAAALASARDLRDGAVLTAPEDGVVLEVFAEPGAVLSAGQPVLRLAELTGREVLIDLTEAELSRLPGDALFDVRLDANPEIRAVGRFASVDPVAEQATRTRRIHIALDDPPEAFRVGALARIRLQENPGAGNRFLLPESAILEADGATFVWRIARPSGALAQVEVDREPRTAGFVLVAGEIAVGDEILLKGVHSVESGQIVGSQVAP